MSSAAFPDGTLMNIGNIILPFALLKTKNVKFSLIKYIFFVQNSLFKKFRKIWTSIKAARWLDEKNNDNCFDLMKVPMAFIFST